MFDWRVDLQEQRELIWLVAITAFLSCMRFKRSDYLLPAYPGAALFLGCSLEGVWLLAHRHRVRLASLLVASFVILALLLRISDEVASE